MTANPYNPLAHVEADTACTGCGYNLRGTARDSICPECGTPVATSMRGDSLWLSPRRWLSRLLVGSIFIVTSILLRFAVVVLINQLRTVRSGPMGEWRWSMYAIAAASLAALAAGAWLLTTKEPRHELSPPSFWNWQVIARAVLLPCIAAQAVIDWIATRDSDGWVPSEHAYLYAASIVLGGILLASLLAMVTGYARRADREWVVYAAVIAIVAFGRSLVLSQFFRSQSGWAADMMTTHHDLAAAIAFGETIACFILWLAFLNIVVQVRQRAPGGATR